MSKYRYVILAVFFASSTTKAENVEVYVTDLLDSMQNGYCLDIAKGKGASANPEDGLQAHTCYSPLGEVLVDQAFDPEKFKDGVLFMPEFDVCVQAVSTEAGSTVELASCDESEAQRWIFSGEGNIAPTNAPTMCLTLAEETSTGRSKENQMKALTLQSCSDELAAFQTWSNRTSE